MHSFPESNMTAYLYPYFHIFCLSAGLILSILYGIFKKIWIGMPILLIGAVYVIVFTISIMDMGLNPFDNTQISEFFLSSLSLYSGIFVFGFLVSSPKKNSQLILSSLKTKQIYIPASIIIGLPLSLLLLTYSSGVWLRFMPLVDKYYCDDGINEVDYNFEAMLSKGFEITCLSDSSFNYYDEVIRMYKYESDRKRMLEIRIHENIYTVSVYGTEGNDKYIQECIPIDVAFYSDIVSVIKLNVSKKRSLFNELVDSLHSFGIFDMNSIGRDIIFNLGCRISYGGNGLYIFAISKEHKNAFSFDEEKYSDYRYNWIIDNFDCFFDSVY